MQIAPRYIPRIAPYIALEQIEMTSMRQALVTDAGVYELDASGEVAVASAIDPPPPSLSPNDAVWLDAHLRKRGLRP